MPPANGYSLPMLAKHGCYNVLLVTSYFLEIGDISLNIFVIRFLIMFFFLNNSPTQKYARKFMWSKFYRIQRTKGNKNMLLNNKVVFYNAIFHVLLQTRIAGLLLRKCKIVGHLANLNTSLKSSFT